MGKKKAMLIGTVWGGVNGVLAHLNAESITIDSMAEAKTALGLVDAFILTGGGDIDPKRYAPSRDKSVWGISNDRDAMEFWLVKQARKQGIPVMGICRGNQLINVAMGGSLFQDISEFEESKHWGWTLNVDLNKKSGLGRFIGDSFIRSSHYHHQAIDRLGNGLMPAAWSSDGFIEAIETWPGVEPFMLGTQFHPEMDWIQDDANEDVFRYFLSHVRPRHKKSANKRRWEFDKANNVNPSDGFWSPHGYTSPSNNVKHVENTAIVRSARTQLEEDWDMMRFVEDVEWDSDEKDPYEGTVYQLELIDTACEFPPCRDPFQCDPVHGDCMNGAIASELNHSRSLLRSEGHRKEITE